MRVAAAAHQRPLWRCGRQPTAQCQRSPSALHVHVHVHVTPLSSSIRYNADDVGLGWVWGMDSELASCSAAAVDGWFESRQAPKYADGGLYPTCADMFLPGTYLHPLPAETSPAR